MRNQQITPENLRKFLEHVAKENDLLAPVEEDGLVFFRSVSDTEKITFTGQNSLVPPKNCFFPQTEQLFTFRSAEGKFTFVEPSGPAGAVVLFGVRPCDLQAILALDPVFNGRYPDVYYRRRREATVIVGLGCLSPGPHCFCTAVGGNPLDGAGADIFLTPVAGLYLVEVLTARGGDLLGRYAQYFTEDNDVPAKKQELAARLAGSGNAGDPFDLRKVKKFLDAHFELPYWEEVSYRCLGCGICTYLCPTCHCFDVVDYLRGEQGERLRCWDSCQFKDFNLMAGGYNPRPAKKERLRNRFLHKLKYHEDRYGMFGCVGCGRCVQKCPANIDIRKIIRDLQEVAGDE